MIVRALGAVVVLVCVSVNLRAHQLDEYLQAARLALSHGRVALELDLTPGVAVAPAIVGAIDSNADRMISPLEARAYASSVLSDVTITLDGRPVAIALESVEVPSGEELHRGTGTIQLRAAGTVDGSGARLLRFLNNHRPDISVYLANALRSGEPAVHVVKQLRDPRQREIQIEYRVDSSGPARVAWLLAGVGGLLALVAARRRAPGGNAG